MEYSPFDGQTTPDQILRHNVLAYIEFIKQAADQVFIDFGGSFMYLKISLLGK